MVALLPAANVLRVALSGTYQGSPWASIYHWKYTGGQVTSPQVNTICQSWATAWNTHLAAAHAATVSLTSVNAVDLTAPDAAQGGAPTLTYVGTLVGAPLTVQVCGVVSWRVNYRWRGGHGRTYLPVGVTASTVNGKSWTNTAITNFETAVNGYLGAINAITTGAITGRLVILRRWYTPIKGQPPVQFSPPLPLDVVAFDVDSRIDTQRRRLGKDVSG